MREYEEYRKILELWELGTPKKKIAIQLNIPRATVRDCVTRYCSLQGLNANKIRAIRNTFAEVLKRVSNSDEIKVQAAYLPVRPLSWRWQYHQSSQRISFKNYP
jgi:hypothetical protein